MKKFLITVIIILCAWSLSFADDIGFGGGFNFFIDYTSVSMGKVNSALDSAKGLLEQAGSFFGITPTESKLGSGILGGIAANVDLKLMDTFSVGLGFRAGYLSAFPGSAKLKTDNILGSGYSLDFEDNYSASLIPLEVGLEGKFNIPAISASLGLGGYLGYGMASVSNEWKLNSTEPLSTNFDDTIPYSGGCLVVDIIGNASVNISIISVGLDLGYRVANVSHVTATKDFSDTNSGITVKKGDTMKDGNANGTFMPGTGNTVSVDFGGLIVGIKFGVAF